MADPARLRRGRLNRVLTQNKVRSATRKTGAVVASLFVVFGTAFGSGAFATGEPSPADEVNNMVQNVTVEDESEKAQDDQIPVKESGPAEVEPPTQSEKPAVAPAPSKESEPSNDSAPTTDPAPVQKNLPEVEKNAEPEESSPGLLAVGADGGTPPYVYWDVRDADTNELVPGATFRFQYRGIFGWTPGTNAEGISDCNGTCSSGISGNVLDRDADGGEFLLEHRGTNRIPANRLENGSNYRVQQVDAPAGYEWVVSGDNTQTIGSTYGSYGTWNNDNGSGTHNFGTFQVKKIPTGPIKCEAGTVYAISSSGQLQEVTSSGVTNLGSPVPGQSYMNDLGVGPDGTVYAVARSSGSGTSQSAIVYQYDAANGTWTAASASSGNTQTNLIGGAVNLKTGTYYFGGFQSNGDFRVYEFDPSKPFDQRISLKAIVDTGFSSNANGDMAFDNQGNLYIVRGSGSTSIVVSVPAADFDAAAGNLIDASTSNSFGSMSDVNGIAFDAAGKVYLGSSGVIRSYDMPGFTNGQDFVTSGLSSTDLASCSSPASVTIEKFIEGARVNATDQFTLKLEQGNTVIGTATTDGTDIGLQDERVGPIPAVRGVQLKLSESGAGTTDMSNYASSYQCFLDGSDVPEPAMSGIGTAITTAIPLASESLRCEFHNSPLRAWVNMHKDVKDVFGTTSPSAGWTMGVETTATTGTAVSNPAATTGVTDADGDAKWEIDFGGSDHRASVKVSETQKTGYEFDSGKCVVTHLDGSTTPTTLTSEAATTLAGIKPGNKVDCTYTNKQKPGAVEWTKIDDSDLGVLLGGSKWKVTGPSFPDGEVVEDCIGDCTGMLDQDPVAGQFKLEGLAWGLYTVTETESPAGHTGSATFNFTVGANNAGTVIDGGKHVNEKKLGAVKWTKLDDSEPANPLAGSTWTLTGPGVPANTEVTDCTEDPCPTGDYKDQDPAPGQFKLEGLPWGEYTLTESNPPEGYTGSAAFNFTVDETSAGTVIDGGKYVNKKKLGVVTWTKTDDSEPANPLAGSTWTLTGPGVPPNTEVTDCIEAPCSNDPYTDQDPAPGQFKLKDLAWGDYTLTEEKAPSGYYPDPEAYEFTIGVGEDASLVVDLGPIKNTPINPPDLPLTGGLGRDAFLLTGASVLVLGTAVALAGRLRKRQKTTA